MLKLLNMKYLLFILIALVIYFLYKDLESVKKKLSKLMTDFDNLKLEDDSDDFQIKLPNRNKQKLGYL